VRQSVCEGPGLLQDILRPTMIRVNECLSLRIPKHSHVSPVSWSRGVCAWAVQEGSNALLRKRIEGGHVHTITLDNLIDVAGFELQVHSWHYCMYDDTSFPEIVGIPNSIPHTYCISSRMPRTTNTPPTLNHNLHKA